MNSISLHIVPFFHLLLSFFFLSSWLQTILSSPSPLPSPELELFLGNYLWTLVNFIHKKNQAEHHLTSISTYVSSPVKQHTIGAGQVLNVNDRLKQLLFDVNCNRHIGLLMIVISAAPCWVRQCLTTIMDVRNGTCPPQIGFIAHLRPLGPNIELKFGR